MIRYKLRIFVFTKPTKIPVLAILVFPDSAGITIDFIRVARKIPWKFF
jgi:hypothetical protein